MHAHTTRKNNMFTLSNTPVIAEYDKHISFEVLLKTAVVTVMSYTNESRDGSYATGLKFSTNTYGYLKRVFKTRGPKYSPDHGVTWYDSFADMKKQRANKVKLTSNRRKEFSFDAIQKINREYNPGYVWQR